LLKKVAQNKDIQCIVEKCLLNQPKKFKPILQVDHKIKQDSHEEKTKNKSQMHKVQLAKHMGQNM